MLDQIEAIPSFDFKRVIFLSFAGGRNHSSIFVGHVRQKMACGLAVVAMPKNAILSTVAMLAAAAVAFFALKSGMVKMEFVGSPVVSAADGRRDEANGTDQQLLRSALSNAAQSSAANQPFISGKKSRFLLTTEAPCALPAASSASQPASLKPETRGAEVQWAKLEFSNGLNDVDEAVVFSCLALPPNPNSVFA